MRSKDVELAEKLGERSKEYYSLCNFEQMEERVFAPNSKFHGQIMEDGYVFNPYIHRRWLPARYKSMQKTCEIFDKSMKDLIVTYDRKYSIEVTLDELRKLEYLRKTSKEAFDERKQFFTANVIKRVFIQELRNLIVYASNPSNGHSYADGEEMMYLIYNVGIVPAEKVTTLEKNPWNGLYQEKSRVKPTPFLDKLRKRIALLEEADTYYEISKAIKGLPIPNNINYDNFYIREFEGLYWKPNDEFTEAYHLAGAYYTLKNDIMFEGKEVNGLKGAAACAYIRELLNAGATAEDFDGLF